MKRLLSAAMISSLFALTAACGSDNNDSSTKSETLNGKSSYRDDGNVVTLSSAIQLLGSKQGCAFELPASFSLNASGSESVELSSALGKKTLMKEKREETRLYHEDELIDREFSASLEEQGVQKEIKIFFAETEVSVEVVCSYNHRSGKSHGGGGRVNSGYIQN